jgi:hypothetical protein
MISLSIIIIAIISIIAIGILSITITSSSSKANAKVIVPCIKTFGDNTSTEKNSIPIGTENNVNCYCIKDYIYDYAEGKCILASILDAETPEETAFRERLELQIETRIREEADRVAAEKAAAAAAARN